MTHRLALVLALTLTACAPDPTSPDANPYAGRTYSRMSPCPPRPSGAIGLCDRGDGQTPRLVSEEACVIEVGGMTPLRASWNPTHPQYQECRTTGAALSTIADIWRVVHTGGP